MARKKVSAKESLSAVEIKDLSTKVVSYYSDDYGERQQYTIFREDQDEDGNELPVPLVKVTTPCGENVELPLDVAQALAQTILEMVND